MSSQAAPQPVPRLATPQTAQTDAHETQALTVSELSYTIKSTLENSIPGGFWVIGEVSNMNRARSNHVYFNLIEPSPVAGESPAATIPVALFERNRQVVNQKIKAHGDPFRIENGTQIMIGGYVTHYAPHGRTQIIMNNIDPAYTLGRIAADRELVLKKLSAEGLLEVNSQLPMPALPLTVGIVTSLGSAAHHDMMSIFTSSGFGFHIYEMDAAVQGSTAPQEIADAVDAITEITETSTQCDVVIVARGGGSTSDLAAFNHEVVGRAIANCQCPVITGIGHETDRSVADDVAHTYCPTPTAAAVTIVQQVETWLERLDDLTEAVRGWSLHQGVTADRRLNQSITGIKRQTQLATSNAETLVEASLQRLSRASRSITGRGLVRVDGAAMRMGTSSRRALDTSSNFLDGVGNQLNRSNLQACQRLERRLNDSTRRLHTSSNRITKDADVMIDNAQKRTNALDPAKVLKRGWTITRRSDGTLIRSVDDVDVDNELVTQVADGLLTSTVTKRSSDDGE